VINLPNDVKALKAMVIAMAKNAARTDALESEVADLKARNVDADERIERLTQNLKAFDRAVSVGDQKSSARLCHQFPCAFSTST